MNEITHNSHNISAFVVEDSTALQLRSDVCRRLYHAWKEGHSDGYVPRSAIDIVEWAPVIGKVAIYDYHDDTDTYFCRLFGGNLIDLSGMDMMGKPMSLYPSTLYQLLRTHYDECRFTGQPFSSTYETRAIESWNDQRAYGHKVLAEKIILPLSRSGTGWDCFFSFVEEIGEPEE